MFFFIIVVVSCVIHFWCCSSCLPLFSPFSPLCHYHFELKLTLGLSTDCTCIDFLCPNVIIMRLVMIPVNASYGDYNYNMRVIMLLFRVVMIHEEL